MKLLGYLIKKMILKINLSELDSKKISESNEVINEELIEFDFSKVIVRKPWGREYLAYTSGSTDIWILYLKKDAATSMHCHPNKKTSLIVLGGEVVCSTLNETYNLKEGDMLIFNKGVFHSTKAVSERGSLVMELESPPKKTDLIRLKDKYGRESKGYELPKDMCFDLSEYERVFLNESNLYRKIGNMGISIGNLKEILDLETYLRKNDASINILIEGEILDEGNNKLFDIGDVIEKSALKKIINARITKQIKIISIQKNIFDSD